MRKTARNNLSLIVFIPIVALGVSACFGSSGTDVTRDRPTPTPAAETRAWLSCKDCADIGMLINLWDSPARGQVIGKLPHGHAITILESREGHCLVSGDGQKGWVSAAMVSFTLPQ